MPILKVAKVESCQNWEWVQYYFLKFAKLPICQIAKLPNFRIANFPYCQISILPLCHKKLHPHFLLQHHHHPRILIQSLWQKPGSVVLIMIWIDFPRARFRFGNCVKLFSALSQALQLQWTFLRWSMITIT